MDYDFSLAGAVRAGSGLLWLALGLVTVAMKPRTPGGQAFAWLLVAFGGRFVFSNLFGAASDFSGFLVPFALELLCDVAIVVLGVLVALRFPAGLPRDCRRELGAAACLLLAIAIGASIYSYRTLTTDSDLRFIPLVAKASDDFLTNLAFSATILAIVSLAIKLRVDPPRERASQRAWGLLLLGWSLYFVYGFGRFVPGPEVSPASLQLGGVVIVLWALAATTGPASRVASRLTAALAGIGLAGMAVLVLAPDASGDVGDVGVARTLGAALVAAAIFRGGLLRLERASRVANRGALATAALAALLIVAQVAQNFFSAEYGLLMGGVIAGAMLFAASPIQRAMEHRGNGQGRGAPTSPIVLQTSEHEQMYREAARLALRDRRLSRDEELHLFRLARGLGLTPDRAHEILVEVERARDATSQGGEAEPDGEKVATRRSG